MTYRILFYHAIRLRSHFSASSIRQDYCNYVTRRAAPGQVPGGGSRAGLYQKRRAMKPSTLDFFDPTLGLDVAGEAKLGLLPPDRDEIASQNQRDLDRAGILM